MIGTRAFTVPFHLLLGAFEIFHCKTLFKTAKYVGLATEKCTYVQPKTRTEMFGAALFITVPNWKQPKCPSTVDCINKWWCSYNGMNSMAESQT